jgi:asparagine synthase (glutamine-hydrolysing)
MCGIYSTNISYHKDDIEFKLRQIDFRGPDNLGFLKIDSISLAHLRLSILDLDKRSNQPFKFKHLYITFNGEIYNFESLKNELIALGFTFETTSDTEVLVKAYSLWGAKLLNKINGMFAFVIYDTAKEELFCARDRLGVKPFFYYWENGFFEICSQLRPLLKSNSKVSEEAISIYLDCGYVPSPFSILENVYKLPPGNFMVIDLKNKSKTISEYWNLNSVKESKITYENAKNELHELIIDAVKIRMQSDVPLGAFLSGGIDSSLVAAIASKLSNVPVNTFTIGFEDPKYDESKVAQQFAEIIGSNHNEIVCRAKDILNMLPTFVKVYDEPFSDSSALPSLLLNSVTKQHATVALSGDGGDESFLGYLHFDLMDKFEKANVVPFFIRKGLSVLPWHKIFKGRPETIKGILKSKNNDDFSWKIFMGNDSLQKNEKSSWKKYYQGYKKWAKNPKQRLADLNIKLWLENDSNVKVDRASMAFSVEVRSPFLDYRIVEFARKLPVEYKYDRGNKKKIIKDILSEYIPQEVFDQPKKGFAVPISYWLKNELKNDVIEKLNDDFLNKIPNLDVEKFKLKMKLFYDDKYDYSYIVWRLYVLALWYKEFDFIKIYEKKLFK